jgi:large subunit ribosomal protein L10
MNQANIELKKQLVEEIVEKISRAKSIVLVDYRGLNVEQVTDLRNKFRAAGVDYKVYKNSNMRFAFEKAGYTEFLEYLKGPNAIAFGYEDAVTVAKISSDFAKTNDKLEIKAGVVDGTVIDANGVKSLASIPPREVLLSMLLSALQGNLRNLAFLLDQVRENKENN